MGKLLAFVTVDDLPDGPHQLQLRGTDPWGRPIASQVIDVVGDVTGPPKPVFTSPSSNQVVTSHHVVVRGTAAPGQAVSVVVARSPTSQPATRRRWSPTLTAPGSCDLLARSVEFLDGKRTEIHLTAKSSDDIGNETTSDRLTFILDLRAASPTDPTQQPATPKPAPAAPRPVERPASAVPSAAAAPELANTGPSTPPGLATALLLILVGPAFGATSRRFSIRA